MTPQQELDVAVKELEQAKAGMKTAGNDPTATQKMQSKLHWLEAKVEKLRRKTQS
jgi:hypothetical protein